jgi:hypothetical protein
MKEQGRMLMKGIDKGDIGVDSGSSLVGGTIAAVQGALDKGIHMLPESLQAKAIGLEEQAKLMLDKASDLAKPVVESYQKEGVVAAAKTAGGLGAGAVSAASASASASAAAASTNIKASAADAATNLQQRAGAASTSIKSTASDLSSKASGAAAGLKQKITGASASAAAAAGDKPKKQRRRRRGGRGHGNRKMKTREVIIPPSESIADTLGEKAKELKEVVVEQMPPSSKKSTAGAGAGDAGLIGGIRNKVAGVTSGISASASGIMSSASSTASGLVAGAQGKLNAATGAVKSTISGSGSSQKPLERKPSLQRRDELPSLGTPQTPEEGSAGKLADGKLAAHPADQSSLLDKAKFAVGGVVEATRDFVVDKLDNISMNADDTEPMSKEDKSALGKAKDQLHEMQQSIKK